MIGHLIEKGFEDITAFGALGFYLIITIFALLLGEGILALKLFLALILILFIIFIIRYFYRKPRPGEKIDNTNVLTIIDSGSFISVHAARVIVLVFLLMPFFDRTILIFFWIVAILVISSRIVLKKHYITDIILGIIFGLVVYFLVNTI